MTFIELRGYEVKFDKNRAFTILRLMSAIPKILIRIKREKAWLGHFAAREGLDLVISDNRYGLILPGTPCVFITHQLLIKTPFGPWVDKLLQSLNYRTIRRFSRCWVPDMASGGLAGDLSHPERMPPIPTRYIGWLSRFGGPASGSGNPGDGGSEPDGSSDAERAFPADRDSAGSPGGSGPEVAPASLLLALLSGPEPQRTLLEKDILRQARAMAHKTHACRLVLVRGLPGSSELPSGAQPASDPTAAPPIPWLTIQNHLPAKALEPLLHAASLVLARPGYSTVMDLERLGKRALFIPTPGQTEQEYLGPYLAAKGWAACVDQRAFSLAQALEMAGNSSPTRERQPEDRSLLAAEIESILSQSCPPALG